MIIAEHCKAGTPKGDKHTPVCEWPEDCYVQWGSNGIVFKSNKGMDKNIDALAGALSGKEECASDALELIKSSYVTAFFEAFPRNPDTFIRGEGKTIEEAERQAFAQFQKFAACSGHEFERRRYTNGAGFCKHCGMFKSKAFEPIKQIKNQKEESHDQNKQ